MFECKNAFLFCLVAVGLCGTSRVVDAQLPRPGQQPIGQPRGQQGPRVATAQPGATGQRPQQPAGNGPRVEIKVSQQMMQILEAWEQRTAKIKRMKGQFSQMEYDAVFKVEKRAVGKYWFEGPDKARLDFGADSKLPDPPQNKIGNVIYTVQAADPKVWICSGDEILDIDIKERTYDRVQIPVSSRGENIQNSPLPFLFGMKANEVIKRYRLAIGSMHDPANGKVHIVAYPLVAAMRREFSRAEIVLDATTFHPTALKLWDPSGNKETVYVFYKPIVNDFIGGILPLSTFKPRLSGYKLLNDFKAPTQANPQAGANGQNPLRTGANQNGILIN